MIDLSPEYLSTVKGILQQLIPEYEVRVFGSRYKWLATTSSDLDLAVVGTEQLSAGLLSNLQDAFADSDLPFKVDVLDWQALSEEFKAVIEQGYEVIQKPSKKLPDGWTVARLGDVLKLNYGKSLTANNRIIGDIPVFGSSGITGWHNQPLINEKGIIIGRKGTVGAIYKSDVPFYPIDTVFYSTVNDIKSDFQYFYYLLQTLNLYNLNQDSAVPGLNKNIAYSQSVILPPLPQQQSIASILSSLDNLIELNTKLNKKLEEIAQAIFKQWFIDFNFPDENGNPYKDSGGEMIDSEMGLIPKGWRVGELGEMYNIFDSKRIPLSSQVRAQMEKIYPYYGATTLIDYVDSYLFDGIYILMGEDGTVSDNRGYPILQYVWGKFWANNHTHVLQGNNNYSTEYLYCLFKNTNV
jgi:type I restriction enzyme S subunit